MPLTGRQKENCRSHRDTSFSGLYKHPSWWARPGNTHGPGLALDGPLGRPGGAKRGEADRKPLEKELCQEGGLRAPGVGSTWAGLRRSGEASRQKGTSELTPKDETVPAIHNVATHGQGGGRAPPESGPQGRPQFSTLHQLIPHQPPPLLGRPLLITGTVSPAGVALLPGILAHTC